MTTVTTDYSPTADDLLLIARAEAALPYAYAPYSGFHVAAALLLSNGVIVTGTNQENAAYPAGMCAERVALFAVAAQYPGEQIRKMVVVARRAGGNQFSPATSCGSCRQVMLEFEHRQSKPFEVIMLERSGAWLHAQSAAALLPFSFNKSNLSEP
jgi:cytidine deaminase